MASRPHDNGDTKAATRSSHVTGAAHGTTSATGATVPSPHTAEELEQMAASSIGAQVILDYNSLASKGARGGAGGTIEENTVARDASLIAVGLDPTAPSGPPTGVPWEPTPPPPVTRTGTAVSGTATRMSSLAAGGVTGDSQIPTTPPEGGGGTGAPANTAVPAVTQAGDTLTCTQGTWSGEPTTYGYQWSVDSAVVGTDSATHTVTVADVGKTATCIVTATNASGSTAAPPSVALTIADPGAARSRGGR
jgi:hypothetical protein